MLDRIIYRRIVFTLSVLIKFVDGLASNIVPIPDIFVNIWELTRAELLL